jgi:ABC-type branched-subunit amino acid transport system substrate-binding protein
MPQKLLATDSKIGPRPVVILFLSLFLFLLLPKTLPAAAANAAASEEVTVPPTARVAVLLPLSGEFAELGKEFQYGFKLGFNWLDAAGEKPQFSVDYLDTESEPETAGTLAAMVATEGNCLLAAGTPLNPCAFQASRAAEANELPYLIVDADQDNLIGEQSNYTFRLTRPRSALNQLLKRFIASRDPKVKSLAIIYDDNPCAMRNARRIRRFCSGSKLDLVIWEKYREGDKYFYDLLGLLRERRPKALLLVTSTARRDRLWKHGTRLELLPTWTLSLDSGCFPAPTAVLPPSLPTRWLLQPAYWYKNPNYSTTGLLQNRWQAAAFAAAEVICRVVSETNDESQQNLPPSPARIVAMMEKLKLETVYGPVAFNGSGRGHQNRLPLSLTGRNENGETKVLFPSGPASPRGE